MTDRKPLERVLSVVGPHKALSAFWISWTLLIVSFAVYRLFDDPSAITAQGVAALTAVLGAPAAFIALYKWAIPKIKS